MLISFLVLSLLPLGGVTLLSYRQVSGALQSQSTERLRAAVRGYGQEVTARIVVAGSSLRQIAKVTNTAPLDTMSFSRELFGDVHSVTSVTTRVGRHDENIAVQVSQSGQVHAVLTTPPALSGRLNDAYLWGSVDTFPHGVDFCVFSGLLQLYCSTPLSESLQAQLHSRFGRSKRGSFVYEGEDERTEVNYWELFLDGRFAIDNNWTVVGLQRSSDAIEARAAFAKALPPMVALAAALVTLMCAGLIRRTLVPLEKLTHAARRYARGQFGKLVEVKTNDEIGELGEAMNGMAQEIDQRVRRLTMLSSLDRAILGNPDLEVLMENALRGLRDLLGESGCFIGVCDLHAARNAHWVVCEPAQIATISVERGDLPNGFSELTNPRAIWPHWHQCPDWLRAITSPDWGGLTVVAIPGPSGSREIRGVVGAQFVASKDHERGLEGILQEVADRVAVAADAVSRDEALKKQAYYDALTGLPNRSLMQDRLALEIARARSNDSSLALIFVDLDRFKRVNDTRGHGAGDALLIEAAKRLRACVNDSDTLARVGGDEFVLVLPDADSPQAVRQVADEMIETLSFAFFVEGGEYFLGASAGVAMFPEDGESADELIKNADTAMYKAKAGGRGMSVFYTEEMNAVLLELTQLESELRHAVDQKSFSLVYQPQVDSRSGRTVCAEALIRWEHAERGWISPGEFIPVAEETGLVVEIGAWVLEESLSTVAKWIANGQGPGRVSVNLAARQLRDPHLPGFVQRMLEKFSLRPEALELEVTETAAIEDLSITIPILTELSQLGVKIAIDDFGTGYSSLSYLRELPFDVVKIDRAFINDLTDDPHADSLVVAIIDMAHALGRQVVAEGVETRAQLEFLCASGCELVQGYYTGRPMPADKLVASLQEPQLIAEGV